MKDLLKSELESLIQTDHINIVDVKEIMYDDKNFYVSSEICEGG